MTAHQREYFRRYFADLPECIREKYRKRNLESKRLQREAFYAQGLNCNGQPRKRARNNGQSQNHTLYMRHWRLRKQQQITEA